MVFSFIFAVLLLVLLIRFKMDSILKIWFFVVVNLALFLALTAILPEQTSFVITLTFSLILSCLKFFHRNFVIHNLTELLIYPGISSVFIPILDFWGVLLLLILISIYDMWAVWHSGVMQKWLNIR